MFVTFIHHMKIENQREMIKNHKLYEKLRSRAMIPKM